MPLTAEERARVRRALGFLNVTAGSALAYGFPLNAPLLTLVEARMDALTVPGEALVREDLARYESVREQLGTVGPRLKAESIKDIKTNPRETEQLQGLLDYWRDRIADDLGVPPNQRTWTSGTGGLNAPVRC